MLVERGPQTLVGNPGGSGGCLLGTRAKSWGVAIPSGSGADGGIDVTGFSATGICDCVLLDMGCLGDAATTGSFITPVQMSSSMLAQSLLSMTSSRHLWSS